MKIELTTEELVVLVARHVLGGDRVWAALELETVLTTTPPRDQDFTIVLAKAGEKKIEVIKKVRAITGLGLREAKDLVEGAPKNVMEGVNKDDAAKIKAQLEGVGAVVELSGSKRNGATITP
jgi:ribosomal protein L7/L12